MGFLSVPGWDRAKPSYLQFMKLTSIKLVKGRERLKQVMSVPLILLLKSDICVIPDHIPMTRIHQ